MASIKAALKSAKSALDSQNYDEAVTHANTVLQNDPQNYYGNVFLGRALEKQQKSDEAVAAYKKASQIKPGEELAWKGLCNAYESRGSANVKDYITAALELAKIYAEQSDQDQCQTTIDKLVSFAKENGNRQEYMQALEAYLPTSQIYDFLEGKIPHPSHTYITLATMAQSDEKEKINREIGERRTRLGAKLAQVTAEVTRENYKKSNLEYLYQQIIDWTTDDETRREYEQKLLERAYNYLTILPAEEKVSKRDEVLKLAHDMVLIKHPFELAWQIELEWKDLESLDQLDKNTLLEYIEFFPDSGMAKILQGYLLQRPQKVKEEPNGISDHGTERSASKLETISSDEQLLLYLDGLQDSKKSPFAHRVVGQYYVENEEYESCTEVSRQGLELLLVETSKSGLKLENNKIAVKTNLATALIYHQSPKNHPESQALFDEILQQRPDSTAALLGIGLVYKEQQEYRKATDFLDKALARDPENLTIGVEAAWCRALNGNIDGGLSYLLSEYENIDLRAPHGRELKSQTAYRIGRCLWDLHPNTGLRKDRHGPYAYFVAAIKLNPSLAPAYTSLGIFYADYADDKKRARQCFQKAFELSASEVEAGERLAKSFADLGDWDIVEIIAQRAVDSGLVQPLPGSRRKGASWPFAALGIVELNRQEYPKAIVLFQSALRISPQDYYSWVGLGESYQSCGRYNAAQKALEHARSLEHLLPQEQSANTWFAQYMLANAHRELGESFAAMDGYLGVLRQRPNEIGVALAYHQTLVEESRHKYEMGFFRTASILAMSALRTNNRIADDLMQKFNFWKAIGDACAIFTFLTSPGSDFDSDELRSICDRPLDYTKIDAFKDLDPVDFSIIDQDFRSVTKMILFFAILAYKNAVVTTSHDKHAQAVAWYNLGWMEFRTYICWIKASLEHPYVTSATFLNASVRCFKQAIELEAGNAEFWNALGVVTSRLETRVSQHAFIRSLNLNEKNAKTWTNLAILYMKRGDNALAHSAFSRAQSMDPDYPQAWLGEGLIALRMGDEKEALAHFTHAFELSDATSLPVKSQYAASTFEHLHSSIISGDLADLAQPIFALQQLEKQAYDVLPYTHLLGLLRERIGDFETAAVKLSIVSEALEHMRMNSESPDDISNFVTAKANFARVQLANKELESAVNNAKLALGFSEAPIAKMSDAARRSARLSAFLTAGLAWYYKGDIGRAMENFQTALSESDGAPDVVCLLAQVLWENGDEDGKENAKGGLLDCIERHPGNVAATTLLGAIAAVSDDEAMIEAVIDDLGSMGTDESLTKEEREKVQSLLATMAELNASDEQLENEELREAQVSIILSPSEASGWSKLAEQTGDSNAAEMTVKLALNAVPPYGPMGVEELASAFASTGTIAEAQTSIVLSPWGVKGWETLVSSVE